MFTGIIQAKGQITKMQATKVGARMQLEAPGLNRDAWQLGESIAVQGVCLTVVKFEGASVYFDVSKETLECTTLGALTEFSVVNLESALKVGDALGGHWVTGHVDAVGCLVQRQAEGDCERFTFEVPDQIAHYIAQKGSITIDGVSLTVNAVTVNQFEVNLIPHTLQVTSLGDYSAGQKVNIEIDIIARYLERMVHGVKSESSSLSYEKLAQAGFIK